MPHDQELDDHDRGLSHDLPALLGRRGALTLRGGAGLGVALAGCGVTDNNESSTNSASAGTRIPEETAGPYPGDGSSGANILTQSGIVRSDITHSFGTASGVARGVPLTIRLKNWRSWSAPRRRCRTGVRTDHSRDPRLLLRAEDGPALLAEAEGRRTPVPAVPADRLPDEGRGWLRPRDAPTGLALVSSPVRECWLPGRLGGPVLRRPRIRGADRPDWPVVEPVALLHGSPRFARGGPRHAGERGWGRRRLERRHDGDPAAARRPAPAPAQRHGEGAGDHQPAARRDGGEHADGQPQDLAGGPVAALPDRGLGIGDEPAL